MTPQRTHRSSTVWPGSGRVTLVLLAAVQAAMAYPWQSIRDRWLLGIAAAVVILLLGRWKGLYFTTILRRRIAIMRPSRRRMARRGSGDDTRTTVLLHITAPPTITAPSTDPDVLPLQLIAGYLDCYGIRAEAIRITSRDTASDTGTRQRDTWIGLTVSAADNLAALRARSPRIPLHQTAEVAVRRLADHLRESGWAAVSAEPDEIPQLLARSARESWRGIGEGSVGYVAAYRVSADAALPDTLASIWSLRARETWSALEIGCAGSGRTLAVACALRTDSRPARTARLPGLTPQRGNHRTALMALDSLSAQRLDGHTDLPADLLERLRWPAAATGPVPAGRGPRHAAAARS